MRPSPSNSSRPARGSEPLSRRDALLRLCAGLAGGPFVVRGASGPSAAIGRVLGPALAGGALTAVAGGGAEAHSPHEFVQGALPYDFSALEGFLSPAAVEAHYRNHHRPQVDRANEILRAMARARRDGRLDLIPGLNAALAGNVSGHLLHSLYWQSVSPFGPAEPTGDLAAHIEEHFGSLVAFRAEFAAVAKSLPGNGWTVVSWEPASGRILLTNTLGDADGVIAGAFPLLALDLHEHAYYPDYGHRRDDYVDKFLDRIQWDFLAVQLKRAH